jgi:predicted nucleotidyltransferase/biotin operon repressor
VTVCIDAYPDAETTVFRIEAADDILRLVADAHESEFTIADLVETTGVTRSTVWRAVDLLESIGAVRVRETPQRNYVSVNPSRLQKDDPVLAIKQPEFHEPVREFVRRVEQTVSGADEVGHVVGIVVFGSVARGEADRQSDIDVFVVVDGDRTTARCLVTDVVSDLSERRFDGDRFDFESYVESVDSARRASSKLREIFEEGITVVGGTKLDDIRKGALGDE